MTRGFTVLTAGMVALFAGVVCPARAGVYYQTFTGTASGVDTNGVFGTAGATLSNVAYTSTYAYDPSQFGSAVYSSGSGYTVFRGGSAYGTTDPLLLASISINGHTYNQSSSYVGNAQLCSSGCDNVYTNAASSGSNYLEDDRYGLSGVSVNTSFTALQSFALQSGYSAGVFAYNGESLTLTETYFAVTNVAPSPPAVVPEPGSLGLLGGASGVFAAAAGLGRGVFRRRLEIVGGRAVG